MFVITGLIYGGAETVTVNLAVELKKRSFDVIVISIMTPVAFTEYLESHNIKLYTLGANKKFDFIFSVAKLLRILKEEKPDVVHAHMYHANIFSRLATFFSPVNYYLVNTIHNTYEGGVMRKLANRITKNIPDLVSQVSRLGYENYLKTHLINKKNSAFVPNSVNALPFTSATPFSFNGFLNIEPDTFIFLAVGRLEKQKDYPMLFKAIDILKSSTKRPFIVCIAGVGALETELKELKEQMGLNNLVHFLGLRKDMPMLMKGADCFVMSSKWEGAPISLLEAMSSGLPVVVTNAGDNKFIVESGINGFISTINKPEELAQNMKQILDMTGPEIEKISAQNKVTVAQNFENNAIVDKWIEVYRRG